MNKTKIYIIISSIYYNYIFVRMSDGSKIEDFEVLSNPSSKEVKGNEINHSCCKISPEYTKFFYDIVFEPCLIMSLIRFYSPLTVILPFQLFTQDSLSNSIRYLSQHLGIYYTFRDPNIGELPRYSFYIMVGTIYYLLHILLWFEIPYPYVFYAFSYISNPGIVELILNQCPRLLDTMEIYRKRVLNYLGCMVLSKIINFICVKNLNTDPQITGEELSEQLTVQNRVYFWSFVKIFFLNSLIKYLERNAYYYSRLIKKLYDWGTLIEVPKHHKSMILDSQTLHPRDTLASIIKRRKWYYFYDPTVLNLIIRIYNEKNGNFLEEFFYHFKVSLIQFVTMWTLSTFIPIPVLCILFRVPEFYQGLKKGKYFSFNTMVMPITTTLLWFRWSNHVINLSFFSEFVRYIDNPATKHLLKVGYDDYLPKMKYMVTHHKKYNFYFLASLPIVYVMGQHDWRYLTVLPLIAKYNFIYIWLIIFGLFSGFDSLHLLILNLMMYLMVNIYEYVKGEKEMKKQELKMDIIQSYWGGPKPSLNDGESATRNMNRNMNRNVNSESDYNGMLNRGEVSIEDSVDFGKMGKSF